MSVLDLFHPVIAHWFASEIGEPTEIQRKAWQEIASGSHVLLTAPTGIGENGRSAALSKPAGLSYT